MVSIVLVKFTFAGGFGFLFAFYAGFVVMLAFADFAHNACLRTVSLEAAECSIQRFVIFDDYL